MEQAEGGCVAAVLALAFLTAAVSILAFSTLVTPILASLLILGSLGLAVMAWTERGQQQGC